MFKGDSVVCVSDLILSAMLRQASRQAALHFNIAAVFLILSPKMFKRLESVLALTQICAACWRLNSGGIM